MDETQTTTQTVATTTAPPASDWRGIITDPSLKELPAVKEAPNLDAFVKRSTEWQSQVGKVSNDFKAFKDSLEAAGKLALDAPDKYQINFDPEVIPEQLRSNELLNEFKQIAHEEKVTQSAVNRFAKLYEKAFQATDPILKYDQAQSEAEVKKLAQERGINYDDFKRISVDGLRQILSKREGFMDKLEMSGLANDPDILWGMYELGLAFQESHGQTGSPVIDKNSAEEANAIVNDKNHPKHAAFWAGDPATNQLVQDLYKKAVPGTYGG